MPGPAQPSAASVQWYQRDENSPKLSEHILLGSFAPVRALAWCCTYLDDVRGVEPCKGQKFRVEGLPHLRHFVLAHAQGVDHLSCAVPKPTTGSVGVMFCKENKCARDERAERMQRLRGLRGRGHGVGATRGTRPSPRLCMLSPKYYMLQRCPQQFRSNTGGKMCIIGVLADVVQKTPSSRFCMIEAHVIASQNQNDNDATIRVVLARWFLLQRDNVDGCCRMVSVTAQIHLHRGSA